MAGMIRIGLVTWLAVVSAFAPCAARAAVLIDRPHAVPMQVPFEAPPKPKPVPETAVPPSTRPLDADELKRAEALLPLLEGKQELWAMGEFVHLGAPAIPVLVKALAMPSPRARYNAIETFSMIKDASVVPALNESAKAPTEIPRIREHALRVAVRLDPTLVSPAIEVMAKDPNPTLRKAAAFEARYVRQKAMVPVLIELMQDDERFVAVSAIQSLWLLTRHGSEMHDWDTSTKQDREEWAQEWITWWKANQETFQLPDQRRPKQPLKQD